MRTLIWSILIASLLTSNAWAEWREILTPGVDPATALQTARERLAGLAEGEAGRAEALAQLGLVAYELNRASEAMLNLTQALDEPGQTLGTSLEAQLHATIGEIDTYMSISARLHRSYEILNEEVHDGAEWADEAREHFAIFAGLVQPKVDLTDSTPTLVQLQTILLDGVANPTATTKALESLAVATRAGIGDDHRITIQVTGRWAAFLSQHGHNAEALPIAEAALALALRRYGDLHPLTADMHGLMAQILEALHRAEESAQNRRATLPFLRKLETEATLSSFCQELGRYELENQVGDPIASLEEAVAHIERAFGPESQETQDLLVELGVWLADHYSPGDARRGRAVDQAELFFHRALRIARRHQDRMFGFESSLRQRAVDLRLLAANPEHADIAERLRDEARAIDADVTALMAFAPPMLSDVIAHASELFRNGKRDEAAMLLGQQIEAWRAEPQAEAVDISDAAQALAELEAGRGRFDAAKEALDKADAALGSDDGAQGATRARLLFLQAGLLQGTQAAAAERDTLLRRATLAGQVSAGLEMPARFHGDDISRAVRAFGMRPSQTGVTTAGDILSVLADASDGGGLLDAATDSKLHDDPEARDAFLQSVSGLLDRPGPSNLERSILQLVSPAMYRYVLAKAADVFDSRGRPDLADTLLAIAQSRARGEGAPGTGRRLTIEAITLIRMISRGSLGPDDRDQVLQDLAISLALNGDIRAALTFAETRGGGSLVESVARHISAYRLGQQDELLELAQGVSGATRAYLMNRLSRPPSVRALVDAAAGDTAYLIADVEKRAETGHAGFDLTQAAQYLVDRHDVAGARVVLARALAIVDSALTSDERVAGLIDLVPVLAATDDLGAARDAIATALTLSLQATSGDCAKGGDDGRCLRGAHLRRIAAAALRLGGVPAAVATLDAIEDRRMRLTILAAYAHDLAKTGRAPEALALAADLVPRASALTNSVQRVDVLTAVASAQAAAGALDTAFDTVRRKVDDDSMASSLVAVRIEAVEYLLRVGALDRAQQVANASESRAARALNLALVAGATAKAGRMNEADNLLAKAVALADAVKPDGSPYQDEEALEGVVKAQVHARDLYALETARLRKRDPLENVRSTAMELHLQGGLDPAIAVALPGVVARTERPAGPAQQAQLLAGLSKLYATFGSAHDAVAAATEATAALSTADDLSEQIPGRLAAMVRDAQASPILAPWVPWEPLRFSPFRTDPSLALSLKSAMSAMADAAVAHGRTDVTADAANLRELLVQARGESPAANSLRERLALIGPGLGEAIQSKSDQALSDQADALYRAVVSFPNEPGETALVLDTVRESTRLEDAAARERAIRFGPDGSGRKSDVWGDTEADPLETHARRRYLYALHLDRLGRALAAAPGDASLQEEAFQVASRALRGELSLAVTQARVRAAASASEVPGLFELHHRIGELDNRLRLLDAGLWRAQLRHVADPAQLTEAERVWDELRRARAALPARFAASLAFLDDAPPSLADTMPLLGEDEAIIAYVIGNDFGLFATMPRTDTLPGGAVLQQAIVIRRSGLAIVPLPDADVKHDVATLRAALVPPKPLANVLDIRAMGLPTDPLRDFPFDAAHRLFVRVLQPAMHALADVRHLMVVPDGALSGLPFAVLLPDLPRSSVDAKPDWLIHRMSLTMLPSVQSLPALRSTRGAATGAPFIGFGNPPFRGTEASAPPIAGGVLASTLDLLPVPGTEAELRAIATSLGADLATSLHMGQDATKTAVYSAPLAHARVIAFATHGLLRREVKGLYEPALALLPGPEDDGLLTAGEIASLRLSADWVLLLACNTARPDDAVVGDQLSALSRAFLYAGARSLLVSQWAVSEDATSLLTTRTMAAVAAKPELRKADALAEVMSAMAGGEHGLLYTHPYFWAPFMVVGNGEQD